MTHSNLTPSFAILAASTYLIGIAGLAHLPASISLSSGVSFLAAQVAEESTISCTLSKNGKQVTTHRDVTRHW